MNTVALAVVLALWTLPGAIFSYDDFLEEQLKYPRVKAALEEKGPVIVRKLKESGLIPGDLNVLFIAYKDSDEIELYARKSTGTVYTRLATYAICSRSGHLGPKRKQGDGQVPEGFYYIDRFNPQSTFYLSLRLNYPNRADRIKSHATNPGGDIFIHGSCVTIGCIPVTDDKIKELYLYAVYARNNGQLQIPVYIFPFKMTDTNFENYKTKYRDHQELIDFWTNLKRGYDKFSGEKKELSVGVGSNGDYTY
jgi:murein L,D-transpeptidase YafK